MRDELSVVLSLIVLQLYAAKVIARTDWNCDHEHPDLLKIVSRYGMKKSQVVLKGKKGFLYEVDDVVGDVLLEAADESDVNEVADDDRVNDELGINAGDGCLMDPGLERREQQEQQKYREKYHKVEGDREDDCQEEQRNEVQMVVVKVEQRQRPEWNVAKVADGQGVGVMMKERKLEKE